MDIARFTLPGDQWADLHRRPTHGQMRQIAKWTQAAVDSGDYLGVEDALILTLIDSWSVQGSDGKPLPLRRESLDDLPQDVSSRLADELQAITDTIRPDVAGAEVSRRIRALVTTAADDKDRARLTRIADDFDKVMGISPNPTSQA